MAGVMASSPTLQRPISRPPNAHSPARASAAPIGTGRRNCLFLLTATTALKAIELPSVAAERPDTIPLFGLRRKIEKAEEAAEEVLKEGIQTAEKGLEAAEKQIETVEKEVETTAAVLSIDAAVQAGAVAGAELLGVVVATSIVNGILGSQTS